MSLMSDLDTWFAAAEERFAAEPSRLPFDASEYTRRRTVLRQLMTAASVDVLILTAPDAMCWLTGYDCRWYRSHSSTTMPPSQCVVVPADGSEIVHIETGVHEGLIRLSSCADEFAPIPGSAYEHEPSVDEFVQFVAVQLRERGLARATVGVERWSSVPNPAVMTAMEAAVTDAGGACVDATALIRRARQRKSPAEIALVERAQHAADEGIRHLVSQLRPGMTELEAWRLYIDGMVAAGGEPTAMHETIAAGPAMPALHFASSRRPVRDQECVNADVAAAVHRYHARVSRMIFLGPVPAQIRTAARILADAHEVFEQAAVVGRTFGDVNRALNTHFTAAGVQGWAGGYELGVSFPPDWVGEFVWNSVDLDAADVIGDGLVTNVEISISGVFMVDTAVYSAGGTRLLSSLPRECLRGGDV